MPKEKNRSHKGAIFQTVEKAALPQVINNSFNKEIKIKKVLQKKKHKVIIENTLCLLAFSVLALCHTFVCRRVQERKIYLPFSKSAQFNYSITI
jgi:hypothetical protein